ncbi:hypothetical protein ACVIF9_008055 [Bradyrhizobium sp. USDA 4350]
MATYECRCAAYPRPLERVEAPNSFRARQLYAETHGCELTDVIARRVDLIDATWRKFVNR